MLGNWVACAHRRPGRETRDYVRCNWAALSCFFSLSTSFFKNLMWRIMFSGESISMEMSLGDGGAETGWSNFSCRILPWKEKFQQWKTVSLKRQNILAGGKLLWVTRIHRVDRLKLCPFYNHFGSPLPSIQVKVKGQSWRIHPPFSLLNVRW